MTETERACVGTAIVSFLNSRTSGAVSVSTARAVVEVRKKIGADTVADGDLVNLIAETAAARGIPVSFDVGKE